MLSEAGAESGGGLVQVGAGAGECEQGRWLAAG